jgi:alpha-N-arabinofuranosidase
MANLAQTINVLQALILTEGDQMVLTPTYHVFDLYQVHQDAALLDARIENAASYRQNEERLPQINLSASQDATDRVHVSLCNLDPNAAADAEIRLTGVKAIDQVTGQSLTASEMNAHNTFSQPENLKPTAFQSFSITGETVCKSSFSAHICDRIGNCREGA